MIRVNSVSLVPTAPHLGHLRACGSNLKHVQNSKHPFTPVLEVAVKFGLTLLHVHVHVWEQTAQQTRPRGFCTYLLSAQEKGRFRPFGSVRAAVAPRASDVRLYRRARSQ